MLAVQLLFCGYFSNFFIHNKISLLKLDLDAFSRYNSQTQVPVDR